MADYSNYANHQGRLFSGVGVGSQATWTDSYGQGNSFTEIAYYRYQPREFTSTAAVLSEARAQMLLYLAGETTEANLVIAPTHQLGAFMYGRVTPSQLNVQIVKPGLCKVTATFAGSESLPTAVSSDTVMIYTAGATNSFGFPGQRLINDIGGTPQEFDLSFYQDGNALVRQPFTRSIIRWEPTIIQSRGPFEDWANKVGHINAGGAFAVPFGPDGEIRYFGAKQVRFDGFQTQYVPGIEADGGVAYRTKLQFSICSTQWVQQAVEVDTKTDADGNETSTGRIIYEDQYPSANMPYIYN